MTTSFIFDLETTSIKVEETTPVQICVVQKYNDAKEMELAYRVVINTYCRPHELIPEEASKVHGITDAKVTWCPDYAAAAWQAHIMYLSLQPEFLIGFNSKTFDEPIMDRCTGVKTFGEAKHIDVLDVAYRFFPQLPSHKLVNLYKHFMKEELTGAHDAAVDVIGTGKVLDAILESIGMNMDQIYEEMRTPKIYSVMPIGKQYRGMPPHKVDKGWARWMKSNAHDMRPDLKATVDYILSGCKEAPW